jgi:pyruvate/2-oxoglutarate dehydrogenase complex dihydrolipoamide acyltransferase (E2) component
MTSEYELEQFPPIRRATIDLLAASSRKHMIHGLIEVDITQTRHRLRQARLDSNTSISLSSNIIYCCARAAAMNPHIQAYRDFRNRLYLFADVDVTVPVERMVDGKNEIVPVIIRKAETKNPMEIQAEITRAQTEQVDRSGVFSFMKVYVLIPRFIRRSFFRIMDSSPKLMKKNGGTVMVSPLNMFGSGTGWGVPLASHTLNLTLGGLVRKPVLEGGRMDNHEFLCITVSIDHDLVDGAPAARFIQTFKRLVEKADGLPTE